MMKSIFDKSTLKGDIFGGITAGVVAIPLALAFGVSSGLGAIYGLYGAFALGIVAAIFGGTPSQISGPTGPMTVITAIVVASAVAEFGNIGSAWGFIIACFLAAGAIQIVLGLLGLALYPLYSLSRSFRVHVWHRIYYYYHPDIPFVGANISKRQIEYIDVST